MTTLRSCPHIVQTAPIPSLTSPSTSTNTKVHAEVSGIFDDNNLPRRYLYEELDDPAKCRAFYSDQLMTALKCKTQELCDETRAQYEQRLERLEAKHQRQLQHVQRQLREVVGSCVSLAEHEQIIAVMAAEQQRHLSRVHSCHASEMRELEQRCARTWQAKLRELKTQSDQQRAMMTERIEQLELHKSEGETALKEHELSELRWKDQFEKTHRKREGIEKQLEDACRLIALLKSRVQEQTKLARELEEQRRKTSETREEVMKCKLAYVEMKGGMNTRATSLKKELDHVQCALECEKTRMSTLQGELAGTRKQLQRQQCATAKFNAIEALRAEHHAAERKRHKKEITALKMALQREKQTANSAVARTDELQLRAAELQLQNQVPPTKQDQRTRLKLQTAAETTMKKQIRHLQHRVTQFKLLVEKLHSENNQIGEEVRNRDSSTEAWARKLFGGRD